MRLFRGIQMELSALDRKALVQQSLPPQRDRRFFRRTGGIACGEVLVVQDPDAHPALFGLVQQNGHIPPPGLLAKALVGPRLHAEGPDVGVIDGLYHLAVNCLALAVDPQKGQNAARKLVIHMCAPFQGCGIDIVSRCGKGCAFGCSEREVQNIQPAFARIAEVQGMRSRAGTQGGAVCGPVFGGGKRKRS